MFLGFLGCFSPGKPGNGVCFTPGGQVTQSWGNFSSICHIYQSVKFLASIERVNLYSQLNRPLYQCAVMHVIVSNI